MAQAPRILTIETEQEPDGRWLAEVRELPGVLAYGDSEPKAIKGAKALALCVLGDRMTHGEDQQDLAGLEFVPASAA